MPQVPYKGAPDDNLQNIPMRPDVPGTLLAGSRAIEGFGQDLRQAGDTVWAEAVRLKTLQNETEANDADTQFTLQAGELHAKYNALQGKDRVDAYPQYQKDLMESRAKIRGSLSNDMSRRMYDHQSLGTMHRTIFNGAAAAGVAQKDYAIGTAMAQLELLKKTIQDDPTNEAAFQTYLGKMKYQAAIVAREKGLPDGSPQAKLAEQDAISEAWKHRIIGVNNVDPWQAEEMRDKASRSHELNPRDDEILTGKIKNQMRAISATNDGEKFYEDNPDLPVQEGRAIVREAAKAKRPDDPGYVRTAENAYVNRQRATKYDLAQQRASDIQAVNGGIMSGVKNEQELRAVPGMADVIDRLPKSDQMAIPGRITRFNAARDKDANDTNFHALKAMANDPKTLQQYLETDVTKYQMSPAQMEWHQRNQKELIKDPKTNPIHRNAFTTLKQTMGPQLEALHVASLSPKHAKEYWQFQAALSIALESFHDRENRAPSQKEIVEEIGPNLVRQQVKPGFWGSILPPFGGILGPAGEPVTTKLGEPAFLEKPTPEFKNWLRNSLREKGVVQEPTDQQYQQAYTRQRIQELHGKKEVK